MASQINQSVSIVVAPPHAAPALCEPVLRSVPEWFGIEESTKHYIQSTAKLPTYIARAGADPAALGFLSVARPYPESADVYCIAVRRERHGQGVGGALLAHAENELRREGVRILQVKTQGPSRPTAQYDLTLKFYLKHGFARLEELHGLWPGNPCLILVKAL